MYRCHWGDLEANGAATNVPPVAKSTRRQRPAHPPARRPGPANPGRSGTAGRGGPPGRGGRPGPAARGGGGRGPAGRAWARVAIPGAVVVVVVAVLAVVATSGGGKSGPTGSGADRTAASATILSQVNTVPAAAFDQVGVPSSGIAGPTKIPGGKALTSGGLPQLVFVGDEWCPICATDRWPLAVALARFGQFSSLSLTKSSSSDSYPDTNTLSFAGASYTSSYLTFSPVELQNRSRQDLGTPTALQQSIEVNLGHNTIPVIDFGGVYLVNGADYDPAALSDMSWQRTAAALGTASDSTSHRVQQDVLGVANLYTAAICKMTGDRPADVCTSTGVKLATTALTSSG
jgi:hypothetical protein